MTSDLAAHHAATFAPALSYLWGANGQPMPQTPLNTTAAPAALPPGPVGNAAGDASFTIWQPGEAAPGYSVGPAETDTVASVPGVYLWDSHFAAWSPDGLYVITPGYTGGRVVLAGHPAPTASALSATGTSAAPLLAPRDAALSALYAAMSPNANGKPPAQYVAWRPDGQVVAAISEPYFGVAPAAADDLLYSPTVALYDTGTGQKLTTLKPQTQVRLQMSGSFTSQSHWLRWSPTARTCCFWTSPSGR